MQERVEREVELLEPMVSLEVAAEMIPMTSKAALYIWLYRNPVWNKAHRHYKSLGFKGEVRMFTLSEIQEIRDLTIHTESRYQRRRGHGGRPRRGVVAVKRERAFCFRDLFPSTDSTSNTSP